MSNVQLKAFLFLARVPYHIKCTAQSFLVSRQSTLYASEKSFCNYGTGTEQANFSGKEDTKRVLVGETSINGYVIQSKQAEMKNYKNDQTPQYYQNYFTQSNYIDPSLE